jgi:glycosyltransferase involved in cell wall biosynthesis
MLTTFYPPFSFGGDGIGVQRLSRALVRRGHEVTVVHDEDAFRALHRGQLPDRPEVDDDEGVTVVRMRSRLGVLSPLLVQQLGRPVLHAGRLRALLAPGKWDVVNFHNVSLIGGPGILHYPRDAVTIYTAHEHWLVCPTHVLWRHRRERCDRRECLRCVIRHRRPPQLWRYTGALERGLRQVDVVVARSEFSRAKHREFGLRREMEVLPYFLPAAVDALPINPTSPHGRPFFFFAGRLERIKGLDDIVPAFASHPEADLVIAGDGEHGQVLRDLARGMPNVTFLGRLAPERLPDYYHHAIATIVPSVCYETFGIVLIEAFRQGSPVLARRIGPFPEILAQAGAGELFETPEELLGALRRLQADPVRRAELAVAGRQAVERHWTEAAVVPRYLQLVGTAASRRNRPDILSRLKAGQVA